MAAWPQAGTGSHHKPAVRLAHQRHSLAPRVGYCANPLMQVLIAPSHEPQERVLFVSLSPRVPWGQERELRRVAGTSHHTHSMGGPWQG